MTAGSCLRWLQPPTPLRGTAAEKLAERMRALHCHTDHMFAVLLVLQWLGGIVLALTVSPRTWIGAQSMVHSHVTIAVLGGALLASWPVMLTVLHPGRLSTRLAVAVSQALFSCLLIHLSGGRIETHFHVFGSLAILAAYRDWRVLAVASSVIAADHFARGVWWPESVFGIATANRWRWVEHTAWVVFEDLFLFIIVRQSVGEMHQLANHMSDLEVAKRDAEQANQAKNDFLVNVSHEIRTPLNGVLGFTEVMQRGGHTADQQHRFLGTIHRSGQHLLRLINDILDLSKIEAGQLECHPARCSPQQVIDEIVAVLRVRAEEKGVTLKCSWRTAIPETIETDEMRLSQVLMNLVGNAIKFTEQGTVTVLVGVHRDDRAPRGEQVPGEDRAATLVIEISDTGIGIDRDHLERIFSPFEQADNSITRRFGGTGLGLPISRQLARSLGGDVTVESQPGQGSCFRMFVSAGALAGVPLRTQPLDPPTVPVASEHDKIQRTLEGMSILLCEDGEINRELIGWVLTEAGAEVRYADDGQQGIDTVNAAESPFDLILMDMQMPVLDGYAATRHLRQQGWTGPIVAITAHAMSGDERRCRDAGCSGYLTKPFNLDKLIQSIQNEL